ncbi:transmembrane protease serine 9 [Aplysia californica]|uniref:Transmembrane protease serine 9 n=1 Tax=Aplysia californica TaxID=6500 RepID=A0ABM0ZY96_APLCA|nr:transmembrane protease serine 9 [Aplysia californica]
MISKTFLVVVVLSATLIVHCDGKSSVSSDYCWFVKGTCAASCDPITHSTLKIVEYMCQGKLHCCLPLSRVITTGNHPNRRESTKAVSSSTYPPRRVGPSLGPDQRKDQTIARDTIPGDKARPLCGRPSHRVVKRVVGGTDAGRCVFPWMVYISRDAADDDLCSGTLISDRHVITAAHCFDSLKGYMPRLVIGEYDRSVDRPRGELVTTSYNVTKHPRYSRSLYNYDVAVLTLDSPIPLETYECIHPICLPKPGQDFPIGTECTVAGWGSTIKGTPAKTSKVLLKTKVPIVEGSLCIQKFGRLFFPEIEICAGDITGQKDSCEGDSGGPLMCEELQQSNVLPNADDAEEQILYLAGVISSGPNPCGQVNVPAIYTKITAVVDWIHSFIQQTRPT